MKGFKEYLGDEKYSKELVITFKNSSTKEAPKLLLEIGLARLSESNWKSTEKAHQIRVDNRLDNMGGKQLHVRDRHGSEWPYGAGGSKNEPNRFTSPATNAVIDIVADYFGIDKDKIEEVQIVSASSEAILMEVSFH